MNTVTRTDLRVLTEPHKGPCISIFLPTHTLGTDAEQEPIRLKNVLRKAQVLLRQGGWSEDVIDNVIRPIRDHMSEQLSCQHRNEGLASFSAPGFTRNYAVPFNVPELVLVGNQFHLKPLFHAIEAATSYCLLTLSQGGVRLYEGDCNALVPMTDIVLPGSPFSPSEHNAGRRGIPWHGSKASGRRFLPFHGATERDGRRKDLLLAFFRRVDEVLKSQLRADHGPIVLAGVTYLCSLYRNVSRAGCVLEEEIRGNPDHISMDELHRRSSSIASAFFQSTRDKTADEYYQLWHTPRASNNVREIAVAAHDGRVKTLFVAVGVQEWAHSKRRTEDATNHQPPGDQDLLNLAALDTFMAGGTVFAVTPDLVPGRGPAAAVFRY